MTESERLFNDGRKSRDAEVFRWHESYWSMNERWEARVTELQEQLDATTDEDVDLTVAQKQKELDAANGERDAALEHVRVLVEAGLAVGETPTWSALGKLALVITKSKEQTDAD